MCMFVFVQIMANSHNFRSTMGRKGGCKRPVLVVAAECVEEGELGVPKSLFSAPLGSARCPPRSWCLVACVTKVHAAIVFETGASSAKSTTRRGRATVATTCAALTSRSLVLEYTTPIAIVAKSGELETEDKGATSK